MSLKGIAKTTLVATGALAAMGAGAMYLLHEIDSKQVVERIKTNLGEDTNIITTWVEPMFQKVNVDGEDVWALVGGVTAVQDDEEAQYHFIASALTGQLLDIQRV
ncbi:MAG: hypothetical protein J6584_03950 [Lactobacillus sp.]|jgi:predicted small secreted protein|uniref:PepSY domain-containing protein n=1 Tax=Bombilactobacillus bombi TaxID=1303590 RepID=A0A347SQG3_9LACO|nr:hypothetical protein [Bombilactobacillus bombi]MCO6542283.1 hypothetical protein [Lactobacillus sp.]AXX64272.1 hypothetical protein DS830_01795 [Bombilactobacillus bombi]MCO6543108.1 hypothetical protein [Lactobacillus sp.]RHW48394.1 hypothetical protein DS832_02210 [Bombilactobacillus bombi]RHW49570.1 hypothetical protein DS831_05225 [Bombilactobacillus bombi]